MSVVTTTNDLQAVSRLRWLFVWCLYFTTDASFETATSIRITKFCPNVGRGSLMTSLVHHASQVGVDGLTVRFLTFIILHSGKSNQIYPLHNV